MVCWCSGKHIDQWNRTEQPEIHTNHNELNFDKGTKALLTSVLQQTSIGKKVNLNLSTEISSELGNRFNYKM